jgi:hypothetical protein
MSNTNECPHCKATIFTVNTEDITMTIGNASSNFFAKGAAGVGRFAGGTLGNATRVSPGFRAGQAVASTLRTPAAQKTAREQAVRKYRELSRASELRQKGLARATSATGAALKEVSKGPKGRGPY